MSPLNDTRQGQGKTYWRSLDDRADTPQFRRFVENEFPAYADQMLTPPSRRNFLKLMGASMALAGMTACRWPSEEILPFVQRPEGFVPGLPQHYATALEIGGVATGLLVKSYDGRPIKIEGNPRHPQSLGASSAIAQASLLDLYAPQRSRTPSHRAEDRHAETTWEAFGAFVKPRVARGGGRVRVLSEASSSASLAAMRRRLLREVPGARWFEYEAVSRDNVREGSRLASGQPARPQLHLGEAEVVFSLDDDFLLQHPTAVRNARDFAHTRAPESGYESRLYVAETSYSTTGAMADHRLALPASIIPAAAGCFAAELFLEQGLPLPNATPEFRRVLERFQFHPMYTDLDWTFAREFVTRQGRSLVTAGPRQPPEVHALVSLINHALGNVGRTVTYTADPEPARPHHHVAIADLAREIAADRVDTLLILGGNPAFDAPADLEFERLLGQVETTIHLGLFHNETSDACTYHLPAAHYLEAWGDARDHAGNLSVVQPLIAPLHGGKSAIEVLSLILDPMPASGHDLVRQAVGDLLPGGAASEAAWRRTLHDGLLQGSAWPSVEPGVQGGDWGDLLKPHLRARREVPEGRLELIFVESPSLVDGRFANNGWLQEMPEPLTKLTWDNAALIAPSTAEALGLEQGRMIRLEQQGKSIDLPVYLMPGQAPGTVGVELGYGRRRCGTGGVDSPALGAGFDVYPLRTTAAMSFVAVGFEKLRAKYDLSTTQDHFAIEPLGRQERLERIELLIKEQDLADFRRSAPDDHHGEAGHEAGGHDAGVAAPGGHGVGDHQLWDEPYDYPGYKWGMTIDLNTCTGCNACVIACQSENNIPVVGKDEVGRGREMHWIRVDRYFSGDPDDPGVALQPVTCQHCENAPCEQVCPVAATMHDHDGLNVMVYNRCIGTRYCANNCPFKVRRFNYFNNHKSEGAVETMVYNPEVTLRSRGVMEKCSFCSQRIAAAKIQAKNEGRTITDGEVQTACQQACPSQAISFGNLNDPHSKVYHAQHDRRAYAMLEETNVRPRNLYLTRLRNRNPLGGPADRG